jgi:pilus assembly protein FimV
MMAPGFGADATGIRTEVLEQPVGNFDPDVPATEDDLDLNLDDFSSALDGGAATVEQPMASRFSGLDLDVGADVVADDEPTGTEEFSPLDPQTMTEVGTKLDLARAYIDMGDPEGAKSILEEVLSEGDAGQRSEAQALIDALPA